MFFYSFKTISGFTLIETMISVLLTAIICSTLMLGITQAKLYLGSIRVKEKAFIELTNYTNKWKSLLAGGYGIPTADAFLDGFEVILKEDTDGQPLVKGRLFKKININENSGDYSVFYDVETYIVWNNSNFFFKKNIMDTLRYKTHQILFTTK